MIKKSLFTVGVCLIGLAALSCVAPFYGTARIEKGFHMDAGLAATSFINSQAAESPLYCLGGRADFEARYGFNQYVGLTGRAGICYGKAIPIDSPDWGLGGNVAIGVQGALPFKFITPAFRLEVTHLVRPTIAPTLLLGIGKREIVTVGARTFIDAPLAIDVFLGIHPTIHWNIFGGFQINSSVEEPLVSVGVGYSLR